MMRAVQVSGPKAAFELVQRPVPEPGDGEVRIRVEACGICHSDSQDTLAFSVQTGVRSMNEVFPLERVADAYERMVRGEARFRVVLATGR